MKTKYKKQNAITLIALVITIIVLLILAGVSIATLTGENGILTQVSDAKEENRKAEIKEKVNLAAQAALARGEGVLEDSKLREELDKAFSYYEIMETEKGWNVIVEEEVIEVAKIGAKVPEKSEYGIYLGQLYRGYSVSRRGNGEIIAYPGIIFYEDCVVHFDNLEDYEGEYLIYGSHEEVEIEEVMMSEFFDEGTTISEDGKTITITDESALNSVVYECSFEEVHGVYFGEEYEATDDKELDDGTVGTITYSAVFNQDGTATVTNLVTDGEGEEVDRQQLTITGINNLAKDYLMQQGSNDIYITSDGNGIIIDGVFFERKR